MGLRQVFTFVMTRSGVVQLRDLWTGLAYQVLMRWI